MAISRSLTYFSGFSVPGFVDDAVGSLSEFLHPFISGVGFVHLLHFLLFPAIAMSSELVVGLVVCILHGLVNNYIIAGSGSLITDHLENKYLIIVV